MKTIYEGVNLHFLKNNSFNTSCIAIVLRQELTREDVTKNALLARVLASGCQKYPNLEEINNKLDNMLGAAFNMDIMKKGSQQLIEIFCEVYDKDNYIYEALNFMSEILFSPLVKDNSFKEEIVEREKKKLRDNLLSREDNKKELAKDRLIENMCKDNAFGIYAGGYIEDIEKISSKCLYEHYKEVLKTAQIDILVMSNSGYKLVLNKCMDIFYSLSNEKREPLSFNSLVPLKAEDKEINRVTEQYSSLQQGKLCLGIKSGVAPFGESFFPLLIGNEILGGNGNSKLFYKIREKENLCYYINSFIYRFSGIICVQCGVAEENFEKTIKLINEGLESVKSGDFSDNELENAKKSIIKSILATKDYNNSIMDFYFTNYIISSGSREGKRENIKNIIKIIEDTNKEDILKAFKNTKIDTIYMMGAKE